MTPVRIPLHRVMRDRPASDQPAPVMPFRRRSNTRARARAESPLAQAGPRSGCGRARRRDHQRREIRSRPGEYALPGNVGDDRARRNRQITRGHSRVRAVGGDLRGGQGTGVDANVPNAPLEGQVARVASVTEEQPARRARRIEDGPASVHDRVPRADLCAVDIEVRERAVVGAGGVMPFFHPRFGREVPRGPN